MRTMFLASMLLSLTLAGCSDGSAPSEEPAEDFSDIDLDTEAGKGLIRGIVLDQAIVPVAGAKVTLTPGDLEATTTVEGLFGFTDLEPGTYFLEATAVGYDGAQQSVEVVADDPTPPVVKIRIVEDLSNLPRVVTFEDTGFIACGWGVPFTYGYCGDTLGAEDDYRLKYTIEGDPDFIQAEIVWDNTQVAWDTLYIINAVCPPEYYENCPGSTSESHRWDEGTFTNPAVMRTEEGFLDAGKEAFGHESLDGWAIGVDVSADSVDGTFTGVTIDQEFTGYVTMFWNVEPQEGWTFYNDGPHPV